MKSIELTEEHKSKLLEMCNELFPEYHFNFHHHDDGLLTKDKNFENYLPGFIFGWKLYEGEYSEYYHDADIFIHWFEFCMTYLMKGLTYYNYIRYNIETKTNTHLIDYLYETIYKT